MGGAVVGSIRISCTECQSPRGDVLSGDGGNTLPALHTHEMEMRGD